jgi:hypothetical protein
LEKRFDDHIDQIRRQNAERFALNQKIRADVHDLYMKVATRSLEKPRAEPARAASVAPAKPESKSERPRQPISRSPNRASWLKDRMRERGWSNGDLAKFRGPDRKTIERIIRGEPVRNDVLEKLAEALTSKHAKVSVLDIPES